MRHVLAVFALAALLAACATAVAPDALLQRGIAAYKSGDDAAAIANLETAAQRLDAPEQIETALVYLALAQFRLGREDAARETLLRLHETERRTPVYASLSLGSDAAEIETLNAALLLSTPLPHSDETARALPPITPITARGEEKRIDDDVARADEAAAKGNFGDAAQSYVTIANTPSIARENIAQAAVGLYRIGAFAEAADAFRKLGTFAKGEEDLRYYYAVALYETGRFEEARKELRCALPYIEATSDVERTRMKIEGAQR